jgi:hypothetical protein
VHDAKPAIDQVRAGSMIGLPDIRPFSLANAMIDPVKVIAPMADAKRHFDQLPGMDRRRLRRCRRMRRIKRGGGHEHGGKADQLWKAATSCGIAVMAMRGR